jgi:thiol-disulfide isomerase/thioredoxin
VTVHRSLLPAILTLGLIAGCGAATGAAQPAGVARATTSDSTASGVARVPEQLQWTEATVDGREFDGRSLAGKPAVLWFWAPWCPTCRQEAPAIGEAARAVTGVTFVGVAAHDHVPAMQEFVAKYRLDSFENIADVDASVWTGFDIFAQPAFAFIGADGTVDLVLGTLSEHDLEARARSLSSTP